MNERQPFAILFLTSLRVARFYTKEEFNDAMVTLRQLGIEFIALKWHESAQRYVVPEVYE